MEDYYDCDADKIQQFAFVEARIKAEYYEDGDSGEHFLRRAAHRHAQYDQQAYRHHRAESDKQQLLRIVRSLCPMRIRRPVRNGM